MGDLAQEIAKARIATTHNERYDVATIKKLQSEVSDIVRKHENEMNKRALEEFEHNGCKSYSYT